MVITDLSTHPTPFVTVQELADYLQTTRRQVYNWIDKGALQAVKHGALLRITLAEAQRFANTPARPTLHAMGLHPSPSVPSTH